MTVGTFIALKKGAVGRVSRVGVTRIQQWEAGRLGN
jgi:hypothetical protein